MADFDPDAYLNKGASSSFDPDAYLKTRPQELGVIGRIASSMGASPAVSLGADFVGRFNPVMNASNLANYIGKYSHDIGDEAGKGTTDFLANRGASPEMSAAGGAVANTATQMLPQIGMSVGALAKPAMRSMAEGLMTRAVNPSMGDLASGDAAKAISTMLDSGISPTIPSMNIVRARINQLRKQINNIVDNSTAEVDLSNVYKPVREALNRFTKQVNPNSDIGAIRSSWEEFLNHPLVGGNASASPTNIPIRTAQDLKTGTNAILGNRVYGELGTASTEAQKQIVRGLKEGVNIAEPAVAPLNAESSALYNVLNVSERAALAALKSNPAGFNLLASNPKAMAAYTLGKSARFKAALAQTLNDNSTLIPAGIGAAAGGIANTVIGASENK